MLEVTSYDSELQQEGLVKGILTTDWGLYTVENSAQTKTK
jgi:hypothetical protein